MIGRADSPSDGVRRSPSLREAVPVWSRIAAESFGGPVAQIAVLHRVFVAERGWVSETRFQRALSFCMLLPGPEAQQLATYLGWFLHGIRGGLVAGTLFVLPGFVALLGLSLLYVYAGDTRAAQGMLHAVQPVVVAIVAHALPRLARAALRNRLQVTIAAASFFALSFLRVPFPIVVLAAALAGALRRAPPPGAEASSGSAVAVRRQLAVTLLWIALWLAPLVAAAIALGSGHVLVQEGRFFATSALVTFGGAYAVLSYVAQEAVHRFHWLSAEEMVTGLGLAESTPGPLIQVVQFVAFLGAFRAPGDLHPLTAAILASVLVTWLTFVPSFLFILALGPYLETIGNNRRLAAALSGISAAVFGAILNLAVWFALHALFGDVREVAYGALHLTIPSWASLDWLALGIALAGLFALARLRVKHLGLILGAATFGAAVALLSD